MLRGCMSLADSRTWRAASDGRSVTVEREDREVRDSGANIHQVDWTTAGRTMRVSGNVGTKPASSVLA
jgi:hypothetical protein